MRPAALLLLAVLACVACAGARATRICESAVEAGTGEPGFWELVPAEADVPSDVLNATLLQLEAVYGPDGTEAPGRWVDCAPDDISVALDEACRLEAADGAESWELRLNLTCTTDDPSTAKGNLVDTATIEASVEVPADGGEPQAVITDASVDLDSDRFRSIEEAVEAGGTGGITVDTGATLFETSFTGCGEAEYLRNGVCTPCSRSGCQFCRACQPGDPMGGCQDGQFCYGICKDGFYTDNRGSCLPCRPECEDCRICQGEPGCIGGYCTSCKDGFQKDPASGTCSACEVVPRLQGCSRCVRCAPGSRNCYGGPATGYFQCTGCKGWGGPGATMCWVPAADGTQTCKMVPLGDPGCRRV